MEQARKDRVGEAEKAGGPADKPAKIPRHPDRAVKAPAKVCAGKAADRVRALDKAREKVKAADKAGAKGDNN